MQKVTEINIRLTSSVVLQTAIEDYMFIYLYRTFIHNDFEQLFFSTMVISFSLV